jgi:hypothetical protein
MSQIMIFMFYLGQLCFYDIMEKTFILETKLETNISKSSRNKRKEKLNKVALIKKPVDFCLLVFAIPPLSGNHYNNLCFSLSFGYPSITPFHQKLSTKSTAITILVPRDSWFSRELPTFDWSNICPNLCSTSFQKRPQVS